MKRNKVIGLGMLVCCVGIQANASVVYEGFDYTVGDELVGQTGGGTGWAGEWQGSDSGTGTPSVETGLNFGTVPVIGGAYQRASRLGVSELNREISGSAQATLTADDSTVWFSVIMDPKDDTTANIQNTWATLVLGDAKLVTTGTSASYAAADISAGGNAVGLSFKGATTWDAIGIQGVTYKDGVRTQSVAVVVGDNVSMVVGQIDWAADGTDDVLSLYNIVDPEAALPAAFATMNVDLDQTTFNLVAIGDGQAALLDEIRFGTTLEEVGVVPVLGVIAVDLAGDAETGFEGTGYNQTIITNNTIKAITSSFATDTTLAPDMIDVAVEASSWLNVIENRSGLTDGIPEGFTYKELYEDLLYASGASGYLTMTLSGLNPNQEYSLTVYSYDPVATDATDKEWSITQGTPAPQTQSVNYTNALASNSTFAMDFTVTSTTGGVIQVQNTAGFSQAALNGFRLTTDTNPGGVTRIVGIAPVDSDTLEIECDLNATPASQVSVLTKNSLDGGIWMSVPHSDDGINPYVITNLSYSSFSGTNVVIYVKGDNAAGFFGLE